MKIFPLLAVIFAFQLPGQTLPPRPVPARSIPVPTDVSPQLQKIIAEPISGHDSPVPKTPGNGRTSYVPEMRAHRRMQPISQSGFMSASLRQRSPVCMFFT